MSVRITIRPEAERDLSQIGRDSEARWGLPQTRAYLDAIALAIERVAAMPGTGADRSDIALDLRKIRSGSHNVYYRVVGETILIVRVLHQRMDIDAHLSDD